MPILWTPKLAVGVRQIDEEHQELFDRVNALFEAMQMAKAKEAIAPIVGFLTDYVNVHFGGEAALMRAHRYPGMAEHLGQHAFFVAEFKGMAAELQRSGPTSLLSIRLNKLLCDWLRDHVSTTDKQLGAFLASTGAAARA